ncbi:hypothetical protein ES703_17974 [subsurface metagenome]
MELQTIRQEIDSPGWLNRLTSRYKRDAKENELRKADQKQKELEQLAEKIATRLGKQDVTTEVREPTQTLEIEKPPPTDNKVDQKEILDLLSAIAETLEQHAEAIESLADKIDEISGVQATRPTGRAPVVQSEPSSRDLEIIEMRASEIGLCGELKRILPFEVING